MDRAPNTRRPDAARWDERWPDPASVLGDLGLGTGDSVVVVGSGDGYFTLAAAGLVAPAPVYAIDGDGTLLDEIEVEAMKRGVGNVTTISGEARSLAALLPDPVDAVLFVDAFHGVDAPTAFAEQISRSLRPGGRFVVVNWHDVEGEGNAAAAAPDGPSDVQRTAPEETRSAVTTAGFHTVEEADWPPYLHGLVFKRAHDR